jgi:hypothetical protein
MSPQSERRICNYKFESVAGLESRVSARKYTIKSPRRQAFIVVVKKTFRYENVCFYKHLCRNSAIRYINMKSGINSGRPALVFDAKFS